MIKIGASAKIKEVATTKENHSSKNKAFIHGIRLNYYISGSIQQLLKKFSTIEKGRKKILVHGNLNSTRTIIDTEDAMSAYWLVAKKGKIGDIYNIGGNKKISVGNFLRKLIKKSSKKIVLKKSKKLIRPKDVTLQIPSSQKFYRDTKLRPKVSFVSDKSFDYAEKIEKLIQKNK